MENKNVGQLIMGISVLIILIILLFNFTSREYIEVSCPLAHGTDVACPAQKAVNQQTLLTLSVVGVLFLVGIVLFFTKPKEKIIIKKVTEKIKKKKIDTSGLRGEDKKVLNLIQENKAIFQADLIEKTEFGKAKISRILDRLENKELIERKRRGMTNIVVLSDNFKE